MILKMESDLEKVLQEFPELCRTQDGSKVKCCLSGHEMPARLEAVRTYVSGKKFAKLKALADLNRKKLEPLIIPSVKRKYQLFCCLTNRYIGKQQASIEKHMAGRRYKKALEKYNAGELSLFKEFKGKGGDADNEEALEVVKGDMEPGEPDAYQSSESEAEKEVDKLQSEDVSMDVEAAGGDSEEECKQSQEESEENHQKKKLKLKGTKKGKAITSNKKQRKTKSVKKVSVISEEIQVEKPGDDVCTRKRKKIKSNSRFKQARLTGAA